MSSLSYAIVTPARILAKPKKMRSIVRKLKPVSARRFAITFCIPISA